MTHETPPTLNHPQRAHPAAVRAMPRSRHPINLFNVRSYLRQVFTAFLLSLTALLPIWSEAQAASGVAVTAPSTPAPLPQPYPVIFNTPNTDLSVKVWGGSIVIQRSYQEGVWYSNPNWAPLKFTYDSLDNSVKTVSRARVEYSKAAPGVYQDPHANIVRQTATGFKWNDPRNNWIEYNPAGEIKAYGDRNGIIASYQYSPVASAAPATPGIPVSEGHISGILDHYGNQALWFEYDTGNQLSRIHDAANHKVDYQTTSTGAQSGGGLATNVLDADGNTWHYQVSNLFPPLSIAPSGSGAGAGTVLGGSGGGGGGGGSVSGGSSGAAAAPPPPPDSACQRSGGTIIVITDPEGHSTSRSWYDNGGLALTNNADGTVVCYNRDYDAAKKIFYTREIGPYVPTYPGSGYHAIPAGTKITETWSELTQPLALGEFLRRDINGITVAKQSVDTASRTTTTTNARGLNTAVSKDSFNNITKTVYPDGSTITNQYDPVYSNLTQHTDENGIVTQLLCKVVWVFSVQLR